MASTKRTLTHKPGGGDSNRKRKSSNAASDEEMKEVETPRRQTRGKNIDVVSMLGSVNNDVDDIEDSGKDPVWKPTAMLTLSSHTKLKKTKLKPRETRKTYGANPPLVSSNNNHAKWQTYSNDPCVIDKEYFNVGNFLILRSDFRAHNEPPLWLIDGKKLLIRYDAKYDNGKVIYLRTNVYSSCLNLRQFLLYLPTKVERSRKSGHITFNRKDVKLTNCQDIRMLMDETLPLWTNFVIFLQIWTSQALDFTFLNEIRRENDEFFLAAMRTVYDQETVYRLNSVVALLNLKQVVLTLCSACADIIVTLHTLKHIKYYIYQQCVQKVKQATPQDENQKLQDDLLDDDWMNELNYCMQT